MHHVVLKDISQLLILTNLKLHLFLISFYWLKLLKDEGGEETGVPEKIPLDELQKMPHTKTVKSSSNWDSNPHTNIDGMHLIGKHMI